MQVRDTIAVYEAIHQKYQATMFAVIQARAQHLSLAVHWLQSALLLWMQERGEGMLYYMVVQGINALHIGCTHDSPQ